jgi:hypothetical protein
MRAEAFPSHCYATTPLAVEQVLQEWLLGVVDNLEVPPFSVATYR